MRHLLHTQRTEQLEDYVESFPFFSSIFPTGSHENSLSAVQSGKADVACVDCKVVERLRTNSSDKLLGLKFIGARIGPNPAQPVVAGNHLSIEARNILQDAFLQISSIFLKRILAVKYVAVDEGNYLDTLSKMEATSLLNILCDNEQVIHYCSI